MLFLATFWPASVTGLLAQTWSDGTAIAATGLVIVFAVLVLLSLFIASLPKVLAFIEPWFPQPSHLHAETAHPESQLPDDEVIAAIGFVLHTEIMNQTGSTGSTGTQK
ncbi:OadG family protein [Rubripirellula amarantea]|nr:OadG family protein [Rubripirellula amarantea]MDA8744142.1 OadG family protein [Rubripirellula amarantea]